jgi:hypothetical protein
LKRIIIISNQGRSQKFSTGGNQKKNFFYIRIQGIYLVFKDYFHSKY